MGDLSASDCSWKKMVIAKTNNKWKSTIKDDESETVSENTLDTRNLCFDVNIEPLNNIKKEIEENDVDDDTVFEQNVEPEEIVQVLDPLLIQTPVKRTRNRKPSIKNETAEERAARLAKMSAYAARRLANESPEQRANRLKRMSEYAAKRLATETSEQRARRLSRMSAYAAQRLAKESPEQRKARLARMSAYAARRQAEKKTANPVIPEESNPLTIFNNIMTHLQNQS